MLSDPLFSPHEQSSGALPHLSRFNRVYVAFRENRAYEGAIQTAIDDLKASGREVELKKFPRGTPAEVISKEMRQIWPELRGKYVFADRTVIENSVVGEISRDHLGILDEVFSEASSSVLVEVLDIEGFQDAYDRFREAREVFDQGSEEYESALRKYYEAFTRTLVRLFEHALDEDPPEQIIIIAERLETHLPFAYQLGDTTPQQRIKQAIVRAGYEREHVLICKTAAHFEKLRWVDLDKAWIVADRHVPMHEHIKEHQRQMNREWIEDIDDDVIRPTDDYSDGDLERSQGEPSVRDLFEGEHRMAHDTNGERALRGKDIDRSQEDLDDYSRIGSERGFRDFVDLPIEATVISLPIESLTLSLEKLGLFRLADNSRWPAKVSGAIQRNLAAAELSFDRKRDGKTH